MRKILAVVIMLVVTLLALLTEEGGPTAAQNLQQTITPGPGPLYLPMVAVRPTPTPTETPTATPTETSTPENTPTPTSTFTPTPMPTPPQRVYFNITVTNCEPNAGVTYVNGATYVEGVPRSGYMVVFSWAPDGPIVARIQSGPHEGYPGWGPGFYSHILNANGPREGNWYFWIVDENETRISALANIQTHGEAGPGKCQQGVVDFDARSSLQQTVTATATPTRTPTVTSTPTKASSEQSHFRLVEQRLWDVVENGGWLDGDSVHCGERRELHVHVMDAQGRPLNGVAVLGIYTGVVEITGQQGKGDGEVEYVLGSGEDVKVIRDAAGRDATSDTAHNNTTQTRNIPDAQLIQARYCKDSASCAAFKQTFGCNGHFSWTVKFQQ
jgi:hypothetical protein